MHITITQDDQQITWFDSEELNNIFSSDFFLDNRPNKELGLLRVVDSATGESRKTPITSAQAAVLFHLIIHGDPDSIPSILNEILYTKIEPIFANWPNNLRPIP